MSDIAGLEDVEPKAVPRPAAPGFNVPQVGFPSRRRLQAYAFDPMSSRLSGGGGCLSISPLNAILDLVHPVSCWWSPTMTAHAIVGTGQSI